MLVPFIDSSLNVFDMDVSIDIPYFKISELPEYTHCYWISPETAPETITIKHSLYKRHRYFQQVGYNIASVHVYIHEDCKDHLINEHISNMLPYLFTYGTRVEK